MEVIKAFATHNPCYQKGTPMTPKGIVVHSTGVNNPYLKRYVNCPSEVGENVNKNYLDRSDANTLVHAFIGYDKNKKVRVAQLLEYNKAAWGVGGGVNGSFNYDPTGHIQFEMCEDGLTNKTYCKAVYDVAVEYAADLCKQFNFDPKGTNVIVSHEEANKLGYGSRHVDPTNWWSKHGYTMDGFRRDVYNKLHPAAPVKPSSEIKESGLTAGTKLNLQNVDLYYSQTSKTPSIQKTGTFYVYDNLLYGDRIKITNKPENIGKSVTGLILLSDAQKSLAEPAPANPVQPDPAPSPAPSKPTQVIKVTYQVRDSVKKKWLPNVVDATDYAGNLGHAIDAIMISLNAGNVVYQAHVMGGNWLAEVKNRTNYAGIYNKPIDAIRIKTDTNQTIHYRVHLRDSQKWLGWVTGYDTKEPSNGYAGVLGKAIDAIEIYVK